MENDREASWLPIGSVVRLRDGSTTVVVTGYMQGDLETGIMWDYGGLRHPQGWTGPDSALVFNRGDIELLLCVGHLDPDGERFLGELAAHEAEYAELKERFLAEHGPDGEGTSHDGAEPSA